MKEVKWLPDDHIEAAAERLLAEFGTAARLPMTPPIPIDDILEGHLGLTLALVDLQTVFGSEDVIGALYIESREVHIDQSLDPSFVATLGRYRFTLAHEVGHWVLHRHQLVGDTKQCNFDLDATKTPTIVCRSSESKVSVEYQANRFAGALLMPKNLVFDVWKQVYPKSSAIYLDILKEHERKIQVAEMWRRGYLPTGNNSDDILFEHVARPFAEKFEVSPSAMRIRLEVLGLFRRNRPETELIPD